MTLVPWKEAVTFFATMFAITNPFGNLAIFIGLTADRTASEQRGIALRTAFASAVIFVVVIWVGEDLLSFLGISVPAFQCAGGIVITLLGLSMLKSESSSMAHTHEESQAAQSQTSIAVVPLAMPIIAGPGAITTILVSVHDFSSLQARFYMTLGSIVIAGIIAVVLYFATPIQRLLGVTGINIAVRIMGLLLIAMAMGMLAAGALALFPGLG